VSGYSDELIGHYSQLLIGRSGYDSDDFTAGYDAHRPAPPPALLDLLCLVAQVERPRLVVDLGAGTGLSTRAWANRADDVVGVEANPQMRDRAAQATAAPNVRYVHAYAHETGVADGTADLVTCSQSFHWMEPEPVLAEAARVLRPGGVFAAYDYDWPPVVHWKVEQAFRELSDAVGRARVEHGNPRPRYVKEEHLERIRSSGLFRFAREVVLHAAEEGSAEKLMGMVFSLGPMVVLLGEGAPEVEERLERLREVVERTMGARTLPWYVCYRVRLGVK
jgi:SAM-dependent methyltransferase